MQDRVRAHNTQKRGGRFARVSLPSELAGNAGEPVLIVALTEALEALGRDRARQARVAELRLFSDLEAGAIARIVGVSERTARQGWCFARAWLAKELAPGSSSS
jgi:hypothetical protein